MTNTAATMGTTRFRFARIICIVSSLGISRAGAIVPETKTDQSVVLVQPFQRLRLSFNLVLFRGCAQSIDRVFWIRVVYVFRSRYV